MLEHLKAPGQTVYDVLPHIERHVRGLAGKQSVYFAGHATVGHVVLRGGNTSSGAAP